MNILPHPKVNIVNFSYWPKGLQRMAELGMLFRLSIFKFSPLFIRLLQYNRFCFSLGKSIQPLYLHVRPNMPLNIDIPSKNMFPNWFWFMFCPGVYFEYTCLPVQHIQEGETPEEFAKRVQKMTADALGIACTTYSYKHKVFFSPLSLLSLILSLLTE